MTTPSLKLAKRPTAKPYSPYTWFRSFGRSRTASSNTTIEKVFTQSATSNCTTTRHHSRRCVSWSMRVDVFTIPSNSTRHHTREVSWDTQIDAVSIPGRKGAHDDITPVSKGAKHRVAFSNKDTARSSLAAQPTTGTFDYSTRRHIRSVSWNALIDVLIIPARDTIRHTGLTPTRVWSTSVRDHLRVWDACLGE